MIRSLHRILSKFTTSKKSRMLSINDEVLLTDIPPKGIQDELSEALGTEYLSKYQGTEEHIKSLTAFNAAIYNRRRVFVSLPTAVYEIPLTMEPNPPHYYNVHYLLDTGSPICLLTVQAYKTLVGHNLPLLKNYHTSAFDLKVAGVITQFMPSNPQYSTGEEPKSYANVNILGFDYLLKMAGFRLQIMFAKKSRFKIIKK